MPKRPQSLAWWVKQVKTGEMTEAQSAAGMERQFRRQRARAKAAGIKRARQPALVGRTVRPRA
jgi:hypothetical protein